MVGSGSGYGSGSGSGSGDGYGYGWLDGIFCRPYSRANKITSFEVFIG